MDAYRAAITYFDEREIIHVDDNESREVHAIITSESGVNNVIIHSHEHVIRAIVVVGPRVPLKSRPAVAELIARAQINMEYARLEFDYDKGALAVRTSVAVDLDIDVLPDTIGNILMMALACLDYYLPAFMAVAFGGHPPARALAALDNEYQIREEEKGTIRIKLPPKPDNEETGDDPMPPFPGRGDG